MYMRVRITASTASTTSTGRLLCVLHGVVAAACLVGSRRFVLAPGPEVTTHPPPDLINKAGRCEPPYQLLLNTSGVGYASTINISHRNTACASPSASDRPAMPHTHHALVSQPFHVYALSFPSRCTW
jgi:hypothetical protein